MMGLRCTPLLSMAAAALVLAGCGSTVKLDEPPVENRTPTAAGSADGAARSGSGAASSGTAAQSQVTTVNLGGAANAAAGLGRVVYFDFDSFVVKDEFRALIEGHAKVLAANKAKRLLVEGHTDERGGREYNLALGQKRAEAVRRALSLLGVADAQVEAVSLGEEKPAATGSDEAAFARNRRAEIVYR